MGLGRVVQKRIHPKARKILISTEEVLEPGEKTCSKFFPPEKEPSKEQEKLLLALALEEGILAVFQNHYYSFDGEVRLQDDGAPIGLELSGNAVKVQMLSWCRSFQARLAEATLQLPGQELYLHQLYVDDNNVAIGKATSRDQTD